MTTTPKNRKHKKHSIQDINCIAIQDFTYANKYKATDFILNLSMMPTHRSDTSQQLRKFMNVKSCVYVFFLRSEYSEIRDCHTIHPSYGYVGETGDLVTRLRDIRMSYDNPKYSVYHGLGRFFRKKNINIDNDIIIRVIRTKNKNEALKLERSIHDKCLQEYGNRFCWNDGAGGGPGNTIYKAEDLIESIKDVAQLQSLCAFIKNHVKTLSQAASNTRG